MRMLLAILLAAAPSAAPGATSVPEAALVAEFEADYPARIEAVSVGERTVRIDGSVPAGSSGLLLADIPMDRLLTDPGRFESLTPLRPEPDGSFSLELPRVRPRSGVDHDRLLSRWRVVRRKGETLTPLSHARYAEAVACRSPHPPAAEIRGKKGLGGWHAGRIDGELERLGIAAVTVNLMVHSLVAAGPGPDAEPFAWQGRTYYANRKVLESFDRTFREAAENGAVVSVILLVANPARDPSPVVKLLGHPGADAAGHFAMPNLVSEEGTSLYGGLLDLMAERWSRPDGSHGRVHHWIVHNEVDAGWEWTNAGELPAASYMDLYQRSLRLTDLIVRQYDPNARAFISLTHHWAWAGQERWHGSRTMLELLARFTHAEGDFPWALAYHPYPQDLRNPRTWEDDQASFTFDSAKVTPRNLEVLDAWMKRPAMRYRGNVRPVHLSENGFNSPDYSETSLQDQAAGMAFAWRKIRPLSSIRVWHYHNWIDNRGEGGLRIGLRRFPDDPEAPLGPKPIWHLYRALESEGELQACAPYLQTVGLSSWDEVVFAGAIE